MPPCIVYLLQEFNRGYFPGKTSSVAWKQPRKPDCYSYFLQARDHPPYMAQPLYKREPVLQKSSSLMCCLPWPRWRASSEDCFLKWINTVLWHFVKLKIDVSDCSFTVVCASAELKTKHESMWRYSEMLLQAEQHNRPPFNKWHSSAISLDKLSRGWKE